MKARDLVVRRKHSLFPISVRYPAIANHCRSCFGIRPLKESK
jgi:hypothetical protein